MLVSMSPQSTALCHYPCDECSVLLRPILCAIPLSEHITTEHTRWVVLCYVLLMPILRDILLVSTPPPDTPF